MSVWYLSRPFPRYRAGGTYQGILSLVALPHELPSAFITRGARRLPRPSPTPKGHPSLHRAPLRPAPGCPSDRSGTPLRFRDGTSPPKAGTPINGRAGDSAGCRGWRESVRQRPGLRGAARRRGRGPYLRRKRRGQRAERSKSDVQGRGGGRPEPLRCQAETAGPTRSRNGGRPRVRALAGCRALGHPPLTSRGLRPHGGRRGLVGRPMDGSPLPLSPGGGREAWVGSPCSPPRRTLPCPTLLSVSVAQGTPSRPLLQEGLPSLWTLHLSAPP